MEPTNPYAAAKAGAELMARAYVSSYKARPPACLPPAWCRPAGGMSQRASAEGAAGRCGA